MDRAASSRRSGRCSRRSSGLFPGLGDGGLLNDDALPEGFTRGTFQLVVFIPLLVTLAIGVIFYVLGRRTREQTVKVAPPPEAMPEVTRV